MMHPSIEHVLKFFAYDHLPPNLQEVSKPFAELASQVANRAPESQETTVALRKLLEAKDAAVRAMIPPKGLKVNAELTAEAKKGFNG